MKKIDLIFSEQEINDLCHELFTVVSGSIGINKSIEDTINLMKYTIKKCIDDIKFCEEIKNDNN